MKTYRIVSYRIVAERERERERVFGQSAVVSRAELG